MLALFLRIQTESCVLWVCSWLGLCRRRIAELTEKYAISELLASPSRTQRGLVFFLVRLRYLKSLIESLAELWIEVNSLFM